MEPTVDDAGAEFLIPDRLWLVAPMPADPADFESVCRSTVRMTFARPGRPLGFFVPAFTDTDLARRFVARLGPRGVGMQAYSGETLDELRGVLEGLRDAGDTHLGLDPEPFRVLRVPIVTVLAAIRRTSDRT